MQLLTKCINGRNACRADLAGNARLPCVTHSERWRAGALVAITGLLLAGCGGGGSGGNAGGDGDGGGGGSSDGGGSSLGIYMGTALFQCDGIELLALVTEESRVTVFHAGGSKLDMGISLMAAGSLVGSGPVYSASVTEYLLAGPSLLTMPAIDSAHAPIQIVSISTSGFDVRWPNRTEESDPFPCTDLQKRLTPRADLYERPASLAKLAGVYSSSYNARSGYAIALSMDANGQLSGSDSQGCVLDGSATVPHPDRNYYLMTVSVDACPSNGVYTGEALLVDSPYSGQDNLLLLDLVDSTSDLAIALALSR